jgi:hypothetical protein
MSLQGLPFLANSDNVKRNVDIQYFPFLLSEVLHTNKYISHFAKLNSECFIKTHYIIFSLMNI